jgi:hypothetical protein
MRPFKGHTYTWSRPYGDETVHHRWELRSAYGGVHFHVSVSSRYEPTAGLEFHYLRPISGKDDAPDHVNCPLTGGRCWHDGTSLYATETLWPQIKAYLKGGEHDLIFRVLEREALRLKPDQSDTSASERQAEQEANL